MFVLLPPENVFYTEPEFAKFFMRFKDLPLDRNVGKHSEFHDQRPGLVPAVRHVAAVAKPPECRFLSTKIEKTFPARERTVVAKWYDIEEQTEGTAANNRHDTVGCGPLKVAPIFVDPALLSESYLIFVQRMSA